MDSIKKLIKSTNKLSDTLNDANQETFTNIVCYLRASSLSERECEESIQEILDMFLTAETNKESVENIIGNNPQKFCDEIVQSYSAKKFSWENILVNSKIILNSFFILWTINIIFDYIPNMLKSKSLLLNFNFSLPFVINTLLITILSFGVFNYVGKTAFKKESDKVFGIKFMLLYIIFMIISIFMWKKLSKIILFTTKMHYVLIFVAISYLILFILSKYTYKKA